MNKLPVTLRLLLSYVFVAVLPITLLATLYLTSFENSLRETVLQNMSTIADKKAEQIDSYVSERMNDIRLLSQRSSIREGVAVLDRAYDQYGLDSAVYQTAATELRQTIKSRLQLQGFHDVLLMDADGNVIFSLLQEAELGTNLKDGPYRNTQLAKAYQLALLSRQAYLSHFASYAPSGGRPAAFVVAPLLNEGVVFGAVALQLELTTLQNVATDPTGLGRSGETILTQKLDDSVLFITPLKKISARPFEYRLPLQQTSYGMQQALAGNHHRGIIRDYAGTKVVAAWRYLPALDWAMVVKINTDEALAPIINMRRLTYIVLGIFFLLSAITAYILGRSVSRPIHKLTAAVNEIAWGNLHQRVPVTGKDELGLLGSTFNHMAEALLEARNTLENKVAERTAELHAASALQKAFLDNANALVVIIDPQGRVSQFNRASELLSGYSAEEVEGKDFPPVFLPAEEIDKIRMEALDVLVNEPHLTKTHYRNHWLCKNGELRLIEWNNSLIVDKQGQLQYVVSVGIDITERQLAEEQVANSTRRLNEAQRIARVGSWEFDLVSRELVWSDEIYRLFGVDKTSFAASYQAFLDAVHPDDRETVDKVYNASIESRLPYEIVHRLLLPDGKIKWVQERGETFYDEQGKPLISKGTVQDITGKKLQDDELLRQRQHLEQMVVERTEALDIARRAREELAATNARLKEAQRVAKVGSWEFDVASGRLYWSDEMYRLHDRHVQQGPPDYEANLEPYERNSRLVLGDAMTRSLSEGKGFVIELCMDFDGHKPQRWVNSICNVLLDDRGKVLSLSGTVQDITAQKMMGEELDKHRHYLEMLVEERTAELAAAKGQAEQANRVKSQFLSNMSHELRTPMNAILGFTQLLDLGDNLDSQQHDYINEILKGGYHLLELINEVLDLARIESGKLDVMLEPVRLGDLVEESFSLIKPLANKKQMAISHGQAGNIHVLADNTRLRQVLLNLLSNAIKYNSAQGSVVLEIMPLDNGRVRVAVVDNGWGIAEENMAHLFQPFFRLHGERSLDEGTGIGLAITKNLVELMGGRIGAESRLGAGSCFWIELPVVDVAPLGNDEKNPATASLAQPVSSARYRILYIEDNPANLKLVSEILATQPHIELVTAHEALLGLDLAVSCKPQLVLLDINMPHLNGYKIIDILHQDQHLKGIPVIAITASAMLQDIERGKAAGFTEYLTKPLDIEHFLQVVNHYLRAGEAEQPESPA